MIAVGLAGCSVQDERLVGSEPAPDVVVDPDTSEEDLVRADDLGFFDATILPGAALAPPPEDLIEAVGSATVVVVAEVTTVQPTRTLLGETDQDQLEMLGVVLRPVEILQGAMPAEQAEVVVEFLVADREAALGSMAASLPSGQAVWFLESADIGQLRVELVDGPDRPEGAYYRLLDLRSGVFVQGSDQVVAGPWRDDPLEPRLAGEPDPPPDDASMKTHGESFDSLVELIAYLAS